MKVLVPGAEGQVGSEMLRLSQHDLQVVGFDRHGLDITDADQVERRLDVCAPDLLVNCAAYTAVDRAEDEPQAAYSVNAEAVGRLGRACRDRGIGIVHLSTDYVFDGTKDGPYVEEDVANPLNVYGASKLAGEELLRAATGRHLILRVSWVFGRVGRSFVDTVLRLAAERDELSVVDDQVGAPTPALAIAQAIVQAGRAATEQDSQWGTYHFTAAPAVSWFDFARRIVDVGVSAGVLKAAPPIHAIPSSQWPTKARRPMNSRLCMERLATTMGISRPDWEPCLSTAVTAQANTRSVARAKRDPS